MHFLCALFSMYNCMKILKKEVQIDFMDEVNNELSQVIGEVPLERLSKEIEYFKLLPSYAKL